MGWKTFKAGRLVCPDCGYDGTTSPLINNDRDDPPFLCVEETTVSWPIVAVHTDGTIQMGYDSSYGDDSDKPRIECARCCGEFPLPDDAGLDWVEDDEIDWGDAEEVA